MRAALAYQVSSIAATGAATASTDNQCAFYVGGNNHVYEAVYDSSGWHGGYDLCGHGLGCDATSPPSVAVNRSNHDLYAFFVGRNGDIYQAIEQSGRGNSPVDCATLR